MRYTYDPTRDIFTKSTSGSEEEKRLAGESAASLVSEGDIVGLEQVARRCMPYKHLVKL